MRQIIQDIKNNSFKSSYLLYGEEAYLRIQYRDKLVKALVNEGDNMNYHYYEGKEINIPEIIDLAETMPFMAEHRVIVIENSGFFQSSCEGLVEYLENPAETVIFIFVDDKVDKRSKLYKVVSKNGYSSEFSKQNEATLKKWIAQKLNAEQKIISDYNCNYFLEKAGTDMANISNELEKLICFSINEYEISREAIDAVCTQCIENKIFIMIENISSKKAEKALELYHDLLTLKESPLGILALIVSHYNNLLIVKILQSKNLSRAKISEKIKRSPYLTGKFERQAESYSVKQLKSAIKYALNTDESIKFGRIQDILALEILIVELCRL